VYVGLVVLVRRQAREQLRGAGCDVAQGYFISHPMPANDLVLAPVVLSTPPQLKVSSQAS
jgi:EAL domain-containing protein (putative c-di-GMP-specific phosphodiesterase class I)